MARILPIPRRTATRATIKYLKGSFMGDNNASHTLVTAKSSSITTMTPMLPSAYRMSSKEYHVKFSMSTKSKRYLKKAMIAIAVLS